MVVAAEALALQLGDKPDAAMNGKKITLAIKFVYVAVPQQSAPKSSHITKAAGLAFLSGLGARWATLLPAARAACVAASAAASAICCCCRGRRGRRGCCFYWPRGCSHRAACLEQCGGRRPRRDE